MFLTIFAKTVPNNVILPVFSRTKEENVIYNIQVSNHTKKGFFKILFSRVATTSLVKNRGDTQIFFQQNDHEGCPIDYLDGLGHFPFGFRARVHRRALKLGNTKVKSETALV